ncbi:DUF58 domain-containing protein [Paenibacillus paeoniae]|uniref:DUF58 domain-containing protein n=1 Tax=Paenibacillus paeoniae TaxID=2292705 RepID=A0A371PHM5_9BACL|nr:DUF58 domain-containing protein [Paenibacillus paeoniae]REK74880.1 DUF58 domain-containing protein [Paenibacillus paeoniae]
MTSGVRYRTRWAAWTVLVVGLIGAGFAAVIRGGAVEWFMFVLLAGIAALSGWLPLAASRSITLERLVSETELTAGESVQVSLRIERMWRIPMVWIAIEESVRNTSSLGERTVPYTTVIAPMFGKRAALHYSIKELARGVHQFGAVTVTCGDLFGLTAFRKEISLTTEFVVLPSLPLYEEGGLFQPSGQGQSDSSAYAVSARGGGEGTDAYAGLLGKAGLGPDSRPYREGDSLRHLDFRAAARGRGMYTKLYDGDETRTERFVVVDSFKASFKGDSGLFDACISHALLDVQQNVEAGAAVRLYADEWTYHVSGVSGHEQLARMSELKHMLARLTPSEVGSEWPGVADLDEDQTSRDRVLTVYSADWHHAGRWLKLADRVSEWGCTLELYWISRSAVPSYAMRETGRLLEASGMDCYWLHVTQSKEAWTSAGKGEDAYALG